MRIADSKAKRLLLTVLDGSDEGDGTRVPEERCRACGNYKVRFESSAGLVQKVRIPTDAISCVTTEGGLIGGACLGALKAAPLLSALKKGAKK